MKTRCVYGARKETRRGVAPIRKTYLPASKGRGWKKKAPDAGSKCMELAAKS